MSAKFVRSIGRTLDARPDRLDLRDREYTPAVASLPEAWPYDGDIAKLFPRYCKADLILDQGKEGACTGFGLACVVNYLFWRRSLQETRKRTHETVSARMLYHLARFYDEWPGEDYDGSSCRGALKAWHKHGVCTEGLWPYRDTDGEVRFVKPDPTWCTDALLRRLGVYYRLNRNSVVDMQAAILEVGAIYVSADVHDGWGLRASTKPLRSHEDLPQIKPLKDEDSLGGHAFALVGYNRTGFVVQNSWGQKWGNCGFAVLPYDQWVKYGTDAWVCALGVPAAGEASAAPVRNPAAAGGRANANALRVAAAKSHVSATVVPWSQERAYRHTIVMGNDGRALNRIVEHANAEAGVQELVFEQPRAALTKSAAKHLVIYAHGGLNSEESSIDRIRTMAPYFDANGVYPLFLSWKTGPTETLASILDDEWNKLKPGRGEFIDKVKDVAAEALDRTVEVLAGPVAKPIWSQMKQNAAASTETGRAGALTVDALLKLKQAMPDLKIHLVGHSAGSILLGHLLDLLPPELAVASCHLYAPACTARFAVDHYARAAERKVLPSKALRVHVLGDTIEVCDTVGPYRKSLLYLVSRALESCHKMPLIGLEHSFLAASTPRWNDAEQPAAKAWQSFWTSTGNTPDVIRTQQISTGLRGRTIAATHGCFDNDAATLTLSLRRMLGKNPTQAVESLDY